MPISKFRKFIIGTALCTTLVGCGGGGGVSGMISKTFETFVGDTVSELADSESLVNLYTGYIDTFDGQLDGGSFTSLITFSYCCCTVPSALPNVKSKVFLKVSSSPP